MNNEQYQNLKEDMLEHIELVVERTVNSKIKDLSDKIDPVVKFFDNITFANQALIWALKLIAIFGAAIAVIWGLVTFFKN
jgi:hypothetical protein